MTAQVMPSTGSSSKRARPKRLKNSVRPLGLKLDARQLGAVEDVDRELERLAALGDADQAVDVLDPRRERVRVDVRRRGVVLARDQAAARGHGEVVRRVQLAPTGDS